MKKESLVSIIIPAYNAERYIKRALESALNQTYKNIEIIIIDGNSIDKTAEIVHSFHDTRVVFIYQKTQGGLGAARNDGIKISKGKYITLLDADDFYLPEKVANQVEFLEKYPEYKIVYCNALHFYSDNPQKIYKKKYKCRSGDIFKDLLQTSLINPNTIMFSKEVIDNAGLFNEKKYYPEDWDMWLRMSIAGFKFGYLNDDLVVVEIRKDSITTMKNQPMYTKNALEMFENIFSQMAEKKNAFYKIEKVLRKMKFKLAIVYLINKRKMEFFKTFINLYHIKFFSYLIGGFLLILPSAFLRICLVKLWRIYQLRSFKVIKTRSFNTPVIITNDI